MMATLHIAGGGAGPISGGARRMAGRASAWAGLWSRAVAALRRLRALLGVCLLAALAASPAGATTTRTIVVPIGKAIVVDLPAATSDVLVSDPTIVETVLRTARQPVLFGMNIGQANILFFDEQGRQMQNINVRVEYDTRILSKLIRDQFPGVSVQAESVLGQIALSGQVDSASQASAIATLARNFAQAALTAQPASSRQGGGATLAEGAVLNRLEVINEEQVMLKVQFAEVNRSVLKEIGVDWEAFMQGSLFSGAFNIAGKTLRNFVEGSQVQFGVTPDAVIDAMEQYSFLRTLAEPTLIAVSGETANFIAGGEFPIPIDAGDDGLTVEFRRFGVGLDFTPVIIGDGRISLRIATEVSELSSENSITLSGMVIPGLAIRSASTTLEMSSGGTMMMAGMIQQSTRRLSSGLPGLRDVPVLGGLFRSEEFQNDETELVVLVTPYIVGQGEREDFRLPTDGFAPASDIDMFLYGRLHALYGVAGDPRRQVAMTNDPALSAPFGYIVE